MTRLGLPQSDDAILRNLKRHAADRREGATVRVVGIDDWSWRKGCSYGTIMVDLERREVVDVLSERLKIFRFLADFGGSWGLSRVRIGVGI